MNTENRVCCSKRPYNNKHTKYHYKTNKSLGKTFKTRVQCFRLIITRRKSTCHVSLNVYVNVGESSVVWEWKRDDAGGGGVWRSPGVGRPGVTTFAEVLLAAVITETASAALQLNFLWATLIFTRQRDTYYFYACASCPVDLWNQLVEFPLELFLEQM